MDQKTYFIDKYLEEYKSLDENKKEEWVSELLIEFQNLRNNYAAISSDSLPEAAEIIGEIRERKIIANWLRQAERYYEEPIIIDAFNKAADTLDRSEHI